eukprot:m.561431 g.561431  ORF g.561431 m.561431 type:complete len:81 (-) comp22217_c0_seq2:1896-2138(-)
MAMKKGHLLNGIFDRLKNALDLISNMDGLTFAMSPDFGVVTSCPTNLGTGMRASVHMQLPKVRIAWVWTQSDVNLNGSAQ